MKTLDFSLIHRYMFDDLRIVLDINSGSLHVVDAPTWQYLSFLEAGLEPKAAEARLAADYDADTAADVADALARLMDDGTLFSAADFSHYKPASDTVVKALCLHMAHDCNLRCGYCFADSGAYGGERGLMTEAVGKAAIDFLIQASGNRRHIEVDFFGGEPLLNRKICMDLNTYGKEAAKAAGKELKCTLTTNGILLDDATIKWLNDNDIDAVLSLDGRPEVHDRMRPFADGKPSYDRVVKPFQTLAESRGHRSYYLRGTYTHFNTDFAQDVMHMADDLGFKELSMEPVVAPAEAPYALTEADKPVLLENYDSLARHYLARANAGEGYRFFHFNIDLDGGPCLPKRLSGCGAGHDYMAVSPEGDLYPCHQFVGDPAYKLGDVFSGIQKPEIGQAFKEADVRAKPTCMACWARFFCSGGCHANNIRYGGGLHAPYEFGCDLQRKRVECALYLKCKEALRSA